MSFDYAKAAATADRLLKRFGAASSLKRRAEGAYDPNTGSSTVTVTETEQPCTAAVFDFDLRLTGQMFAGQSVILAGDKLAYVSAVGVSTPADPHWEFYFAVDYVSAARVSTPAPGDFLVFGGVTHSVIAVKRLAPSGIDVLHELQVRQ